MSCPLELDGEALRQAASTGAIVTYEDHNARTGLGSLVANFLVENGLSAKLKKLGVTRYGRSGKPDEIYKEQGLDSDSLVKAVKKLL